MSYQPDTNVVSVLLRSKKKATLNFRQCVEQGIAIPSVVLTEIWTGLLRSPDVNSLIALFTRFGFAVTPFDSIDARCAGQALARDLTLVTPNTREFGRVPGLRIEDWEA